MNTEDASKLISELYNAETRREISDILEYMEESGSGVFVYPILDGYKKYKHSSVGYSFIWSLAQLDYPDLGQRLNELLENYEVQKEHIPMMLFFMAERKFFSDIGSRMAAMYLDYCTDPEFQEDFNLNGLAMECVLDYLHKGNLLLDSEGKLRELIFDGNLSESERVVVLSYLLEIRQGEQMNFFIENYFSKIQKTELEKNIAQKLLFYKTDSAKKLKKLIMENGLDDSAEILRRYEKNDIVLKDKEKEKEEIVYSNMDSLIKIGILREQINDKTLSDPRFGFKIFPETELLVHQSQSIDDKEIFFDLCKGLLEVIDVIDPQVKNHKLNPEEVAQISDEASWGKEGMAALAQLFSFMSSKEIAVSYNFYGFRELSQALNDIVEHSEKDDFWKRLKRLGIEQMYREKKWHKLHNFFLNYYAQTLENMNRCLNQLASQDLD